LTYIPLLLLTPLAQSSIRVGALAMSVYFFVGETLMAHNRHFRQQRGREGAM
jgi:hypothetical protein